MNRREAIAAAIGSIFAPFVKPKKKAMFRGYCLSESITKYEQLSGFDGKIFTRRPYDARTREDADGPGTPVPE